MTAGRSQWVSAHHVGQTDLSADRTNDRDIGLAALALSITRPAWMADAECAKPHVDLATFFPVLGETAQEARAICRRCSVSAECLEDALARGPLTDGVWGGTTRPEREQILRKRKAAA